MVELVNQPKEILAGNDGIVIRKYIDGIEGGRALDITDFKAKTGTSVVKAGAFIIKDGDAYKVAPLATGGEAYDSTFAAAKVVGVLVATIDAAKEGAGIMINGKVNKAVLPYGGSDKAAAVAAVLSNIQFMEDGE